MRGSFGLLTSVVVVSTDGDSSTSVTVTLEFGSPDTFVSGFTTGGGLLIGVASLRALEEKGKFRSSQDFYFHSNQYIQGDFR